jgi:flagellar motility protein MotE (MotC chaperone)
LNRVRLLPIVIFAALALLVFKGIGIVTNGGYVLTGTTQTVAQAGEDSAAPSDAVVGDTSPIVADTAPSMAVRLEASSQPPSSSASGAASGATVSTSSAADPNFASQMLEVSSAPSSSVASAMPGSASASSLADTSMSSSAAASAPASASEANACPDVPRPSAAPEADINDKIGNALAQGCPAPPTPVNENGDALPTTKDGNGKIVPLQVAEGDDSQAALLEHLNERRNALDKRQADLDMREALVAAAEKKLDDRTTALQALQAQVNALVDQKQAEEDASFKAVVSMYEAMKPKDAAKIFDTLDLGVLLKIARAMSPRSMSPILAAMSADPAQKLTTALASVAPITTVPASGQDLAALPQIVGQ